MALYTFYTVKSTSPVAAIDIIDLDDDRAATNHAALLCETRATCVRMEVWHGERLIADRACIGGWLAAAPSDPKPHIVPTREFASAKCPATGDAVQTHARLTRSQIASLKTTVVYWCSVCSCAHEAGRDELVAPGR